MKLRKTLAGILGAVVMLLGVGTFEHVNREKGVKADDQLYFTKVSSGQTDWSGDYLIVYDAKSKAFDGSRNASNIDADNNVIDVVISGDKIAYTPELGNKIFTITEESTGKYSIKSKGGAYIGRSGTSNGMDEAATYASSKHAHTISYANSTVSIASAGGPKLQTYISGANVRFRYYASSQKAISLYKLEAGDVETPEHTCEFIKPSEDIALVSIADCVNPAVYAYVCKVEGCGKSDATQTYTVGEPLGHDYKDGSCSRCKEIDAKYHVNQLFNKYYNSGSYVKETVLNINEFAKEEVEDYLHAGAQIRYRKTTYAPGELTMVTKEAEADAWGTHTSTYKDNGNGGVDHLTNGVKDYSVSGTVNGQDRSSVENWYVTLFDLKNSTFTNWECTDGVYTLSLKGDETATKMAREFVAPMWLDNETTKNYVTYDKLTVEEVGNSLVMKVYITGDNSGLLIDGANLVLAQATIERIIDTNAKDVTESLNLSFTDLVKDKSGDTYLEDNYPTWTINGTIGKTYGGYLGFGKSGDTSSSITSPEFVASKDFVVNVVLKGNGSNGVATSTMTFEVLDKNGDVITNSVTENPANSKDTTYSIEFTYNSEKSYKDAAYIRLSFTKNTGNIGLKSLSVSYVD